MSRHRALPCARHRTRDVVYGTALCCSNTSNTLCLTNGKRKVHMPVHSFVLETLFGTCHDNARCRARDTALPMSPGPKKSLQCSTEESCLARIPLDHLGWSRSRHRAVPSARHRTPAVAYKWTYHISMMPFTAMISVRNCDIVANTCEHATSSDASCWLIVSK